MSFLVYLCFLFQFFFVLTLRIYLFFSISFPYNHIFTPLINNFAISFPLYHLPLSFISPKSFVIFFFRLSRIYFINNNFLHFSPTLLFVLSKLLTIFFLIHILLFFLCSLHINFTNVTISSSLFLLFHPHPLFLPPKFIHFIPFPLFSAVCTSMRTRGRDSLASLIY